MTSNKCVLKSFPEQIAHSRKVTINVLFAKKMYLAKPLMHLMYANN